MNPPPPYYTVKPSSNFFNSIRIQPEGAAHIKIVNENKKKALEKTKYTTADDMDRWYIELKAKMTDCVDAFCICNKGCHQDCECSRPSYISNLEDEREGAIWELDCKDVWHLTHYE